MGEVGLANPAMVAKFKFSVVSSIRMWVNGLLGGAVWKVDVGSVSEDGRRG